ncbi:MAG: ABC transporter substrate-binding protein [Chloroflexi bacterium]|nr:ABC transporter substrate-binding protein [Chloroflexota bacterium]
MKTSQEAVKVGAVYPLTGPLATTGTDVKNGVLLAVDIINNEYDLPLTMARAKGITSLNSADIEIIFGDSEGSPASGRSEAERLIDGEKVVAIIGCYQSSVTAEVSQVVESRGIPFLAAMSTAPSLTQRGLNWFFRTTPNGETFVQNFYEFLNDIKQRKDIGTVSLGIVYEDSIWGSEVNAYGEQYAGEYGYQVVESISYPSSISDVSNQVQRLKETNPDIVMQASYISDAILYMQAYKEAGFSPDAILADNSGFIEPEFLQVLGDDGNYILTRETWAKDMAAARPLVGTINQMFRERYGTDMNGNSARAFTGVLVLADAINRAGSTKPEAIREAMLETDIPADETIMPWDGVRFDEETHQNALGKGIICQVIEQEYCTVWPWELASKELIWPMPEWEEREQYH